MLAIFYSELLYAGPSCKKTSFGYTQDRKPAFYEKFVTLLFRLSVMLTKDLAPFSYISPQKNPLVNDKV